MQKITLCRKNLFRSLEKVPNCVLDEIIYYGPKVEKIKTREEKLKYINSMNDFIETENLETERNKTLLNKLLLFVEPNSDSQFQRRQLLTAYYHIMSFEYDPNQDISELRMCKRSSDVPICLDLCMLYRKCEYHDMVVSLSIDPETLLQYGRMLDISSHDLRKSILLHLSLKNKEELVKSLSGMITKQKVHPYLSSDRGQKFNKLTEYTYFNPVEYVKLRPPLTHDDAVIALIIVYRIIYVESDVLEFFKCMSETGNFPLNVINPDFFSMSCTFHEKFAEYYTDEELESVMKRECSRNLNEIAFPEFYWGIHPHSESLESIIEMLEVKDIDSIDKTLTFVNDGVYRFITFDEYIEYMEINGPCNPLNNNPLEKHSIDKLISANDTKLTNLVINLTGEIEVCGTNEEWKVIEKLIYIDIGDENYEVDVFDILNEIYEKVSDEVLDSKILRVSSISNCIRGNITIRELFEGFRNISEESSCMSISLRKIRETVWYSRWKLCKLEPFELNEE